MDFTSRALQQTAAANWCGLIEKGVRVEGTIRVPGTFRVDCEILGNILSDSKVILAENASVEGEIHAVEVTVSGAFKGKICASGKVQIQSKGHVIGEIHAPCVQIEEGGMLDGVCLVPTNAGASSSIAVPIRPGNSPNDAD